MTRRPDQEPWANIRSASTTSGDETANIKRPRRARSARRRQAPPHRLAGRYGPRTPVTLTLTIRTSSEVWCEVLSDEGRFYVAFDASVFDLVQQVIHGGHWVEDMSTGLDRQHRSGKGHLANPS